MGAPAPAGHNHLEVVKAAVPQQQPAALHRAQQAKAPDALAGMAGTGSSIDHTVGATFDQIDPLEVGKGTGTARTGVAPKGLGAGRGIGPILAGAAPLI